MTTAIVKKYIGAPYLCHTNSVTEWPSGMSLRILAPRTMKAKSGAAEPSPYPTRELTPKFAPVSAGANRIQAPRADATSVAVARPVPATFLETMKSSTLILLRPTYHTPSATKNRDVSIIVTTAIVPSDIAFPRSEFKQTLKSRRPPLIGWPLRVDDCTSSLRWHYPDQVVGSSLAFGTSQPGLSKLPPGLLSLGQSMWTRGVCQAKSPGRKAWCCASVPESWGKSVLESLTVAA